MKNINDVYKRLKKEYPKLKILYTDKYTIVIEIEEYKIEAYEETVNFCKNKKWISHRHSNYDYNELYNDIIYYIENRKIIKKHGFDIKVKTRYTNIVFILF